MYPSDRARHNQTSIHVGGQCSFCETAVQIAKWHGSSDPVVPVQVRHLRLNITLTGAWPYMKCLHLYLQVLCLVSEALPR